jgi:RNA methyltransferase, TrmH family
MLSKNKVKHIISLQRKKTRDDERLFVIEGDKIVKEFLGSGAKIQTILAKPEFIGSIPDSLLHNTAEVIPVSYDELKKLSSLKTPHNAMAVVRMPENPSSAVPDPGILVAALDFIQDPGNLGTIIRAASWFGIGKIVCSENCVDVYNPKVIQATMGAILNVEVQYTVLEEYLSVAKRSDIPVYGTLLEGEPVYQQQLGKDGIILLGNESRGISESLLYYITQRITIPKFTVSVRGIESLNAGMAASVIFSEFRRRDFK